MLRRVLAVLVLALAFGAVAACGGGLEGGGEEARVQDDMPGGLPAGGEGEAADPRFADGLPELDFNGQVFTFLVQTEPAFRHLNDVNVEELTGDVVLDSVYNRNRAVEERLGVVITDEQNNDAPRIIANSVAAGEARYNGVWLVVHSFFNESLRGSFLNLHNVPHLDLEKLYWDQNAVGDMTIQGRLHGVTGDITTATHQFTHLLMYNLGLGEAHGFPDLYQAVRDGAWTFDMLNSLTRDVYRDLNGSGIVDEHDFFGVEITQAAYESFFSASGERWIEKDAGGDIIFSDLTERKLRVLGALEDMFTGRDSVWLNQWTGNESWAFAEGRAIFFNADVGIMSEQSRATVEFDFGILPLPKFDAHQERYYVYAFPFFPFLSIPVTVGGADLEMTGAVFEALAAESYRTLTPAFYDVALAHRYARDEASHEMLDIILRSRIYDILYWGQWDHFRHWDTGIVGMLQRGGGAYVSAYERHIDRARARIDEIMEIYAGLPY